jgi:hypothetical protein
MAIDPAAAISGSLVNANAALQAPGSMGGVSAPAQAPGPGTTSVNAGAGTNTNQANLQDFITQYQSSLNSAQQGITSSVQQGTETLQNAISGLTSQEGAFNAAQQAGLESSLSTQATKFGGTLVNAAPTLGTGGLSQNAMSLQMIQNDNNDTIKQLQASATAAMANGDVQFATQISQLQAQQYSMALNAKEAILSNLVQEGSSVASLSQAQTAQATQQEQQLNDMATLASKYGVTVQPGWSLQDVVNKVAPIASEQERLTLGTMQSQINSNNAQASLAAAQASVISPLQPDQISSLITWYTDQPVGSPQQQTVGTQIGTILANNPKNAVSYANSYNQYVSGGGSFSLSSPGGQNQAATWVSIAKSNNMSVQDAISGYVTNNPGVPVTEKSDLTNYMYAAYGVTPSLNPWSTVFGRIGEGISTGLIQLGQFQAGQPVTGYAASVAQMGAYQFNRDNAWSANTPGANYYVNQITGNRTTSYNQYLNTVQSSANNK